MNTAGWGPPPPKVVQAAELGVFNTSRLLCHAECQVKYSLKYIENLSKGGTDSQALTFGRVWHDLVEQLADGPWQASAAEEIAKKHAIPALIEAALAADAEGLISRAKELRGFAGWIDKAAIEYVKRGYEPVTGKTLGVELEFWLLYNGICFVGRMDKIAAKYGNLTLVEHKTCGEKTTFTKYIAMRNGHLQDAIYWMALHTMHVEDPKQLLGYKVDWDGLGGVQYDLLRKRPYPKVKTKAASLEDRIEQWPHSLFHYEELHWDSQKAEQVLAEAFWIVDSIVDIDEGERDPYKNRSACMNFDNIACEFWHICWGDADESKYGTREPDYVDNANMMTVEQ